MGYFSYQLVQDFSDQQYDPVKPMQGPFVEWRLLGGWQTFPKIFPRW